MPEYNSDEKWSDSQFRELVMRGRNYRETYEFSMFGETVELEIGPLTTNVYRNLLGELRRDLSDEEFNQMMGELQQMDNSQKTEAEVQQDMNMSVAVGQIGALVEAAKFGIDPESVNLPDREAVADTVNNMIGGAAIDIGVAVMELTDDLQDADEFPGGRGGN